MRRLTCIGIGLVWMIALGSSSAFAYIPPSSFLVKSWVKKHAPIKTLKVRTLVTAYENNKPTEVHFKETFLIDFDKDIFLSWVSDDTDKRLYSIEKSLKDLPTAAKMVLSSNSSEVIASLVKSGISVQTEESNSVAQSAERLQTQTENNQVKNTQTENNQTENKMMARWNGGVAWVVGSQGPKDQISPQLWMQKDTFLPLRIIYTNPTELEQVYDFQFENFHFFREFPYPRVIKVLKTPKTPKTLEKTSEVIFSSQLIDFNVNPAHLLSTPIHPGYTEAGNSIASAVRDSIRIYYDIMR